MKTLIDLIQEDRDILDELEENGGELTSELEERLAINRSDVKDKIERYFSMINRFNNQIENIDSEIKRLQQKKKTKERSIENMKSLLDLAMPLVGTKKIGRTGAVSYTVETDLVKALAVNYPKVILCNEDQIENLEIVPDAYKVSKLQLPSSISIETSNKVQELLKDIVEIKEEISIDKVKAAKDLKEGIEIEGLTLVDNFKTRFS